MVCMHHFNLVKAKFFQWKEIYYEKIFLALKVGNRIYF